MSSKSMSAVVDTAKNKIKRNYLTMLGITLWEEHHRSGGIAYHHDSAIPPLPKESKIAEQTAFIENRFVASQEITDLDWTTLENSVRNCSACPLHRTRTQSVFGSGNRNADWLIIGEAPGAEEDRNGLPFIGAAGQLLTQMLNAIGLQRENVYITNVLKSRPPENRTPNSTEIDACRIYLDQQIALIQPKIILACGAIAAQTLLQTKTSITALRNHIHHYGNIPLIATYHPAYLLRDVSEKRKAWDDLRLALRVFNRVTPDGQID